MWAICSNSNLCINFCKGKPLDTYFLLDQTIYSLWWPSLTEDLQTKPQKVLCVGVILQVQSVWFILHTNERSITIIL